MLSICEMDYFSGYCLRNGIDLDKFLHSQKDYFKMLIVDYIIFNSDRHGGNWGIYFNADTGICIGLHPLYDHNLALNPDGDYNSKVMNGKTLEECARYSKKFVNLDMTKLKKWLKLSSTKSRLKVIDNSGKYYKSLLDRIKNYESWN